MSVYSFSQIQTYLKCPLKYRFRYIDKLYPEEFEASLELILWQSVHKALEILYSKIGSFVIPSLDETKQIFLNEFTLKVKNWDFSEEDIDIFKNRWLVYIENHYKRNYPFKDIKVLATEMSFYFKLDDWINFKWVIDRVDKKDDILVVNDYKTNKILPTDDAEIYEEQVVLYSFWLLQKYWKVFRKVVWKIEYLHFDLIKEIDIDDNKIDFVVNKYKNLIKEIEDKRFRFSNWDEEAFEPIESSLCRFCDYQSICPLFSHWFGKITDEDLSDDTIKGLIDEYVELQKRKSEIEKQMKQNKEILEQFVRRNWLKKIYWRRYKISVSKLIYYKIKNKDKLKNILEELKFLEKVLDVDRFKLKKVIESWEVDFEKLKEVVEKSESLVFRWSGI